MLIDNHLSSIDAALMIKPYLEAEVEQVEKTLTNVFKVLYSFILSKNRIIIEILIV